MRDIQKELRDIAARTCELEKRAGAEGAEGLLRGGSELTTEELRRRASEQQIPGRSTMTRDDLVATVDPR